jgi:NADH:ubiquinone oxidoreductase subunit 6 (subunit J)
MAIGFAVAAILSIAICVFALHVARDPKRYRLLWLDLLGVLDVDSTRELRRTQEMHMAVMAYVMFVLFLATAMSCSFWARDKTAAERDNDFQQRQIEKVGRIPRKR